MKYKPYDEYKKSGVNLLEQIPKNWQKYSFKELFTKKEITNLTNEGLLSVYLDRGVIPYSEGGGLVHKPSESLEKYQLVDINDFVMNNQQAWRGSVGISNYRGIVSPAYLVFSTDKEKADPSYLKYLLKDNISVSQFSLSSLSVGTIQRQVKWHLLRNISLFLPSLDDQLKISKFLDKEILKIDNLISKQEKLIKLLDEQRKSIISHAVTKGLNPDAPMKDSGVEWLGAVPEHWDIKPIKSLYSRVKRTGFENETLLSVYREYGVIVKSSRDDNHNKESDDLSPYQLVNVGDLVINKMKAWQGSLAISEHRGIVSPAYYIYEPFESDELNNKFIHNQIRSQYFIQSYKNYSKGIRVGQWDLESDLFVRINLYIPPADEQNEIVDYIQSETNKINNLIDKQKLLIEKLQEYRSSIISHAVTGKIDVREAL